MEIFIKLASREFEQLRTKLPAGSHTQIMDRATRIEHSVDGVLFEGYTIPCGERDARKLLETAAKYCPEVVSKIQEAIRLAESDTRRRS
jgi:hypothetical protein